MSVFFNTYFNRIFWLTCGAVFIVICLRAFLIPFSHDEAATFFFYVQSDNFLPYKAHVYTNNHVLNSALANLCYHIAGPHRFVLRLPNIFAFVLLCIGIYRHFNYLKNTSSKALLAGFFLLTFNFLDFFELCRGYGLSMGCLMLGLSYLADYFSNLKFRSLVLFFLFLQLSVAANLILVVVALVLLIYTCLYQVIKRVFVSPENIILVTVNLFLLIFWIKFSFFYAENGALDYGVGDNYWEVTFKTLMLFLFGTSAGWLQIIILILFALIVISSFLYYRKKFSLPGIFSPNVFYGLVLLTLVVTFYLQKKLLHINFPEDRTGLFFFLFFVLGLSFAADTARNISLWLAPLILTPLLVSFIITFNVSYFSSFYYHTMPRSLYQQLEKEYEKDNSIFTIGGHRVREMNYAFLNYKGMLNPMDPSEEMQMNCDYYYAMKIEKPYYERFYTEIGYDAKWDKVLLKRKEKIAHSEFYNLANHAFSGNNEFYEFKRINDTVFATHDPVELYSEISFVSVPKPFNAFLVLEVKDEKNETTWYKRMPLNWLDKNLNGKTKYIKLTTGNLPKKTSLVAYIWNIDKQPVNIRLNNLKLYQLHGKGVDVRIPADYYTLIYNLTNKPLL